MTPHKSNATNKMITMADIAERSGFSKFAVSLALRDDPRIKESTRAHIRAVAAEMGYDPNHHAAARRMALRKQGKDLLNHTVALLFTTDSTAVNYFARLLRSVVLELSERRYSLVFLLIPPHKDDPLTLPDNFARGDIDGLIWGPGINDVHPFLQELRQHPLLHARPVVSMLSSEVPGEDSVVFVDHCQGGYLAARHLLELGHRHFLQFCHAIPEADLIFQQRLTGIRQALAEFHLDEAMHLHLFKMAGVEWIDPKNLYPNSGPAAEAEVSASARKLIDYLSAHQEITALMALNDATAIQAWYAVHAAGWRVPEDISIIGFDGTDPMIDDCGRNILTTVSLPLEAVGREAVRILIEQIETGQRMSIERLLPVELRVNRSTAPARECAVSSLQ